MQVGRSLIKSLRKAVNRQRRSITRPSRHTGRHCPSCPIRNCGIRGRTRGTERFLGERFRGSSTFIKKRTNIAQYFHSSGEMTRGGHQKRKFLRKIKHSVGLTWLACHARRSWNVSLCFSNSSPKENTVICQQFLPLGGSTGLVSRTRRAQDHRKGRLNTRPDELNLVH
jgi:hypothetical protein